MLSYVLQLRLRLSDATIAEYLGVREHYHVF
jgi:hypothetical protein